MTWTVFGGHGFIGRAVVAALRRRGETVLIPARGEEQFDHDLGHVIYAIGLTADFRQHLNETVEAHVGLLSRLLQRTRFSSFLYLSSTRVYQHSMQEAVDEESPLVLKSGLDAVYNASKIVGESLCLSHPQSSVRVARLSNVYGDDMGECNFLGMVLRDAVRGKAAIQQPANFTKDYIDRELAVYWLLQIAERGKQRLYNVCSGELISHQQIAHGLNSIKHDSVSVADDDENVSSVFIHHQRVRDEFPAVVPSLLEDLPHLYQAAQRTWATKESGDE